MFVQRVVSPVRRAESWTVLGDDDAPVGPIERVVPRDNDNGVIAGCRW